MPYSIIKKSQLEGAHRLDAEYYQPEYLELENNLENFGIQLKTFRELLDQGNTLTGGATPLGALYQTEGVKFLRVQNIMPGYLDLSDVVFIEDKVNDGALKRSRILNDDVLLTITGVSYGKAAVYRESFGKANINQHSVRMHFKPDILPEYVAMFLNSKYGKFQSDRKVTGDTRPALAYEEIREYKIPFLDLAQQQEIKNLLKESGDLKNEAENLYRKGEEMLLEELDLQNFQAEDELFSIVNLSEIKNNHRMDAEYYQKKYERLIERIKSRNAKTLKNFVGRYSTGFPFKSENYQEEGIPLIRINNIGKGYLDLSNAAYVSEKDYLLAPKDMAGGGNLVISMSGTIGMTALIPEGIKQCSINQRILRISTKNIDKEYLTLVLNSIIGLYQLQRIGTGGVQTNISYKDIQNILIPDLPEQIQQKIAELVRQSKEARKKAKVLLEQAKHEVEEMIEKGGENHG